MPEERAINGGELNPAIITQDNEFNKFLMTLPENQRQTPESKYYTYKMWKIAGKPKDFNQAVDMGLYQWHDSDKSYHGTSVIYDEESDVYHFLKPKDHSTIQYELDWYNKGVTTDGNGNQYELAGNSKAEWEDFRRNYYLDSSGDDYAYRRIPTLGVSDKARNSIMASLENGVKAALQNKLSSINQSLQESRVNKFDNGGRILDGTSEENQTLSNNSAWKTIGSTAYDVLELIDPTGITSWATPEGDLRQAIEGYKQGENGFGKVALEAVGAIPLLGKVGKAVKLTKGLSNADKVLNTARKAFKNAEQVDTLLELIPGVKKAASATQGFTGTLLQGAADAMNLSSNARHYTNIGTVLLNNANTVKDVIDVFNLDRNPQHLLDNPYTRTEYMSYWDAPEADKNFLPASKGKYDIFSRKNETDEHTHYDVIEARYKKLIPIMKEKGFNPEEINRLSPFLVTQMILEGGWNISNENNNFGGMLDPKTRKKIKFDSEEDFYRTYLDNLDKRWGDDYLGKGKGWRNAKDLKHYADIVNREDLRLHTEEAWEEYNRTHPKSPAYIYTPLWENNNTGLMSEAKFGGIEERVSGLIDLLRLRESTWDKYARSHNILKEIK